MRLKLKARSRLSHIYKILFKFKETSNKIFKRIFLACCEHVNLRLGQISINAKKWPYDFYSTSLNKFAVCHIDGTTVVNPYKFWIVPAFKC